MSDVESGEVVPTPLPELDSDDTGFADIMAQFVPETDPAAPVAGAPAVDPALPVAGQPTTPGGQPGAEGEATPVPTPGDERQQILAREWAERPADWQLDAGSITDDDWGNLHEGIEVAFENSHQQIVNEQFMQDMQPQINAIREHPRALIGKEVPSLIDDKTIVLKDSQQAADWQAHLKSILDNEFNARVDASMESARDLQVTLSQSVELFRSNPDLVPGTKQFNKQLADDFATMAKPYELRLDGKLLGYSIEVQPMIGFLRQKLGATTPTPVAGAGATPSAAAPAASPAADPPQAGIQSRAGNSSGGDKDAEDLEALFNTLPGAPGNLRI